jgi:hypothetical protein
MKLIGAGLPRTGTLSQKIALELLGLEPCYHMVNVIGDLSNAPKWRAILDGEMQLQDIFEGFQASVDWPGSFFYKELVEIYPDAKVLLSTRDGDSWARSMYETIYGLFYRDILIRHMSDARACVDTPWHNYMTMMREMWQRSGLTQGADTTLESMAAAAHDYEAEVQASVPSERLLVWSVADGWEPLCEFLELPMPDQPFPRVNDSAEFAQRIIDGSILAVQKHCSEQADRESTVTG